MTKPFIPFPVGTVRGPFTCGLGSFINGHNQGVQYAVRESSGCWRYFIGKRSQCQELARQAREYSRRILIEENLLTVSP